jgi:hypothetical protein
MKKTRLTLIKRPIDQTGFFHYAARLDGRSGKSTLIELQTDGFAIKRYVHNSEWQEVCYVENLQGVWPRLGFGMSVKYNPVYSNCEHFARYLVTSRWESTQVNHLTRYFQQAVLPLFRA